MIKSSIVKVSFFHLVDKNFFLCFLLVVMLFVLKKCLLHFLLLVTLFAHVAKRSNSRLKIFFKTRGLKNFATLFTGKYLCGSHFLILFQDWRPAFLYKKRLQHRCFSVNIAKVLRTAFLWKTCPLYLSEILFDDRYNFRVIFYYCKLRLNYFTAKICK